MVDVRLRGWQGRAATAAVLVILALGQAGCSTSTTARVVNDGSVASSSVSTDEVEVRKRARLRLELALNYFDQGQVNVALDEVRQVLLIDPNFADAYNLRGLIYMRLNDARQAQESFQRALSLNSEDADTLHNYGWLQCLTGRYEDGLRSLDAALAVPGYRSQAKTYLSKGLCQARAGDKAAAEAALAHAYELDAGNPITGYNLSVLLYQRGDYVRAQFYIRRINNSELANAETLWLGARVERRLGNAVGMNQLIEQLNRRFPKSREAALAERGAFDE